jgi:hypothetical protein
MRLLLATIMAFAAVDGLIGQVPTKISEVGTFRETVTDGSSSYPIFEYDGKFVLGDLSLEDYRAALNIVTPQLEPTERITTVSALIPSQLQFFRDMGLGDGAVIVFTCIENCSRVLQNTQSGASGRLYALERIAEKLRLFKVIHVRA